MRDAFKGLATRAIHSGHNPATDIRSWAVPLYKTTSCAYKDTTRAAEFFTFCQAGFTHTRIMNSTFDRQEQGMAAP